MVEENTINPPTEVVQTEIDKTILERRREMVPPKESIELITKLVIERACDSSKIVGWERGELWALQKEVDWEQFSNLPFQTDDKLVNDYGEVRELLLRLRTEPDDKEFPGITSPIEANRAKDQIREFFKPYFKPKQ